MEAPRVLSGGDVISHLFLQQPSFLVFSRSFFPYCYPSRAAACDLTKSRRDRRKKRTMEMIIPLSPPHQSSDSAAHLVELLTQNQDFNICLQGDLLRLSQGLVDFHQGNA